jgi:predicted  nucleic acid-binding Zn-ribbon protein
MGPGMTFRCTCERCGDIFFSPDRRAKTCPKCIKRYGLQKRQETQARPPASAHAKPGTNARPAQRQPTTAVPTKRKKRIETLTEELREAILKAYEKYKQDPNLKLGQIHAKIAAELNTKRQIVAEAIHGPQIAPKPLTPELRQEIISRYQQFVQRLERPEAGRRKTIAAELGLPLSQVASVLREWKSQIPDVSHLTREQMFQIEKAYWHHLQSGTPFEDIPKIVARELGFTEWQVLRRIDMLHDSFSKVADAPEPPPEIREAIEQAYLEYLKRPAPPPDSLHSTLAKRFGVTPKQVFRVLLEYRRRVLQNNWQPAELQNSLGMGTG